MTTPNTPLKPCPNVLCGSDDTVVDFNGRHWCECAACGCKGLAFDDASEAIAHWNARPQVKVKPLRWDGPSPARGYKRGRWSAEDYSVVKEDADSWRCYYRGFDREGVAHKISSEAKAAAQADHESRILSALGEQ